MKKKFLLLLITVAMAISAVGCDKSSESSSQAETSNTTNTSQSAQLGTFDIEVVRKNIIIKGQPFEIPVALKDLPEGWTWKEKEQSELDEGNGLAYIYYNGEEMFIAGLENFYEGLESSGIVYNLTIKTDDCSIDGLIPFKSTKQNVVGKYGEPVMISGYGSYYYGTTNNNDKARGRINEQNIIFKINDDDTIKAISITYADLSNEY
ncbi:hypothetical protein [Globicatella sulfidifaciens]|uniref:Lipoprotein n=1 Tax=Globicatella sulfidifaciens TaxID=136093 RepID=A0A7X8H0P6_9LACT|nr:hypothetical protein [Globicatella sulfidifaciens]NLJ19064.1 hypothetical protein [Globicatella sulfidifaciens]